MGGRLMPLDILAKSAEATFAIAETIGRSLPAGVVVLLEGELGAGKTVFAKGLGSGLGVANEITSPSYNLMLRYKGRLQFDHWDLYRISDIDDDLEFLESIYNTESVKAIEWADKLKTAPDMPILRIRIEPDETDTGTRRIVIEGDRDIMLTVIEPALEELSKK